MESPVPRSALWPEKSFEDLAARASTDPSRAGYFAARLVRNKHVMTIYAACMGGLIAIFVVLRLFRSISARSQKPHVALRPALTVYRLLRKVLIRPLRLFNTNGELLLNLIWISINIILTFVNQNGAFMPTGIANRTGWLASANMAIIVFLAMKNTPLAILTQYSYERLNGLHRVAGYTMFVEMILHASMYTDYFLKGDVSQMTEHNVIAGYVLGFAVLFTVAVATFMRRKNYELFYIIHASLIVPILVTFALHQPDLGTILPIALVTAGLWFYDRLIRASRLLYNSINNTATIHPLPHGGTRVVLKKPLFNARAGKHCYLWLPSVRTFQTHPFTIVSNNPLELVVSSQDGFTKELHEHALANPGATIKASVEGPYGTYPDPASYDKVVLISGGSGATFTHGLATHFLDKITQADESKKKEKQQVDLVWAVRSKSHISWFAKHLETLIGHERRAQLKLRYHVTGSSIDDANPVAESSSEGEDGVVSSSGSSIISSPIDDEEKKKHISGTDSRQQGGVQQQQQQQQHPALISRDVVYEIEGEKPSASTSDDENYDDDEKKALDKEIGISLARLSSGELSTSPSSSSSSAAGGSSSGNSINEKNTGDEEQKIRGGIRKDGNHQRDPEKCETDATVSPSSTLAAMMQPCTTGLAKAADGLVSGGSNASGMHQGSSSAEGGGLVLVHGRPDIHEILRDVFASQTSQAEGGERRKVLVAACGPPAMLDAIRRTVAEEGIRVGGDGEGVSVEIHCEQFGW